MGVNSNPQGFKATKTLRGDNCFRSSMYPVDDSNPTDLSQGDPVVLSSGKVVLASANGTAHILGVIRAVYEGRNRPRTHALPSSGNFLARSTVGWVDVIDDPDVVFVVDVDSAAAMTGVGSLCEIVAPSASVSAGDRRTGQSRVLIDGSTIAAQTSANVQTLPYMVVGTPSEEEKAFAGSATGYDMGVGSSARAIEVIINDHVFRPKFPS
jgi:hypothetical protein